LLCFLLAILIFNFHKGARYHQGSTAIDCNNRAEHNVQAIRGGNGVPLNRGMLTRLNSEVICRW
jgi:hypothetical protein